MKRDTYVQEDVYGGESARPWPRDRVRWGAVVAGLLTAITTMLVLGVLGVAIGLSAEPGTADLSTGAIIWGALAAIIAFFVGGFVASRTAGVAGPTNGALNGLMVGIAAIVAILWLVGSGVGNLLGAAATNLGDIITYATATDVDVDVGTESVFENAETAAWGTFVALVLALGAAAVGGLLGFRGGPIDPDVGEQEVYGGERRVRDGDTATRETTTRRERVT